jgi:hypothetical protein
VFSSVTARWRVTGEEAEREVAIRRRTFMERGNVRDWKEGMDEREKEWR